MIVGIYYHILEIGIVYEKGGKRGRFWRVGERKRLIDECNLWRKIITLIDLPERGEEEDRTFFQELEAIAKKYNNPNYQRICELKETLISEKETVDYRKEDVILVNNFLSDLLKDMAVELNKFDGKAKVYRIMAVMHNLPRVFYGKDALGESVAIKIEDAIKYAAWNMSDDMREKYKEYMRDEGIYTNVSHLEHNCRMN